MVSGGAEGGRSQGEVDRLTNQGGVTGSEAGAEARGSICQSEAGDLKTLSKPTQYSAVREEGLKGTSGGGTGVWLTFEKEAGKGGQVGTQETQ